MPKGSCVCGDFIYEFDGQPEATIICHCIPCQKTAGPNGSYNLFVQEDKLKKLSGTPKPFTRRGDSGKPLDYALCDTCGTIMWCTIGAMPGVYNVKAGTLDDRAYLEKSGKPVQEIYTRNRPGWCGEFHGVEQKEGA